MSKILMLAHLDPDGGVAKWIEKVVQKMTPTHHVHLLSSVISPMLVQSAVMDQPATKWEQAPLLAFKHFFALNVLLKEIKAFQPDYIVCHEIFTAVGIVVARLFSKPIPITIVVHGISKAFNRQLELKSKLVFTFLSLFLNPQRDRLVVVSPATMKYIRTTPLAQMPLVMIPNGIETQFLNKAPIAQDSAFKHFAFIGRLNYEKGPDQFLQVARELASYPAKFHLIGEGEMHEGLRLQVEALHLQNHVVFHGWVDQVSNLLAGMDALLITSRTEGLPFSILEAFQVQVPVVGLNVGGVSYPLQNGKSGTLCESLEEMIAFLKHSFFNNPTNFEDQIQAAQDFIKEELSLEKMLNRYDQLWP
ncbi:glycosyltransferase [Deltaproteobacteria bacterium TL4]